MSTTRTARFLATTALAVVGAGALGVAAASATAPFTQVDGNPTCADLAPAGVTWTEHKLDFDPAAGDYQPGGFQVTISKAADGSLGWTSQQDVAAVIMKGGPTTNVYAYPGSSDLSDSGLRTPENPNGNQGSVKYYGISHVTFCAGPAAETPGTPETPTPETPKTPAPQTPSTPTPQVAATSNETPAAPAPAPEAAPAEVPTEVLGESIVAPAPTAAAPAELAVTGLPSSTLALVAVGLVLVGGLALALGGRPAGDVDPRD